MSLSSHLQFLSVAYRSCWIGEAEIAEKPELAAKAALNLPQLKMGIPTLILNMIFLNIFLYVI